jgi:predicted Zn-dependent protease
VNPQSEFLETSLGELELRAGRAGEAEAASAAGARASSRGGCRRRSRSGELLVRSGRAERGGGAGAQRRSRPARESGVLLTRLGEIELRSGDLAGADLHLAEATRLLPEFATSWRLWAEVARLQGDSAAAQERAARARALAPARN